MTDKQGYRIIIFRVILFLIFFIYSARLFSMQILSGEIYLMRAQDISRRTYSIQTQRGEIYDRTFTNPLVINRDTFAVTITPADVPRGSIDSVIASVSEILKISVNDITARLPSQYLQLYQPVEIASNVPFTSIAVLAERKNELPGISWYIKSIRNYVDVGSISHILGYVGDITRDELTTLYNQGYQMGDMIGKTGIEKQYDELLRGKIGWETRTVDSRGRRITGSESVIRELPVMGRNLVLTIDANLQSIVEKAIGPQNGAAVVIKPATGEILAMVSYPWYDPNVFTDGLSSDIRILMDNSSRPLLNRAIQSSYPPASTFKIIMSTAIIADSVFPLDQTILCTGVMNYGGRNWQCHLHSGHGRLNLTRALGYSCNIYYMTVGRDYVTAERIVRFANGYGYGHLTGIDLPGEDAGLVPTPQWKERRYHEAWMLGDTMNMSIGQSYTLVTPLQMSCMLSMVVNGGKMYKPFVLKEVRDPVTNAVEIITQPQVIREGELPASVYEAVRQDLRSVVTAGNAQYPLNIRTVQIAGKSGTAEIGANDRWHSWFTAYAPFNSTNGDDQIVVTVIIEASTTQTWRASAACAIIFQAYFGNQTYDEAIRFLGYQYML